MLVLTRKEHESIIVRDDVVVTVAEVQRDGVVLGVEAPQDVEVHCGEAPGRIIAPQRIDLVGAELPEYSLRWEELPVTVGRDPDVELRLPDPYVSHYHCKIDQVDGTVLVRDLGSRNGTFINGVRVTESHLMPGDRLTVGRTNFHARYQRLTEARHDQKRA